MTTAPRRTRLANERGITLTEVMIVAVIGLVVLFAMGGFYLQSQTTWLDASAQSITQREVTLLTQAISDSVRSSSKAVVTFTPDADHCQVAVYKYLQVTPSWVFWWDAADSLVHGGPDTGAGDKGPIVQSKIERFALVASPTDVAVTVRARAATGRRVESTMNAVLLNRP